MRRADPDTARHYPARRPVPQGFLQERRTDKTRPGLEKDKAAGDLPSVAAADPDLLVVEMNEIDAALFECQPQLRFGGTMGLVAASFVIADGAARDTGAVGEIRLRPVEQPAGGATESWAQYFDSLRLTHRRVLPILVDINHI
jgi:hypothetical protein